MLVIDRPPSLSTYAGKSLGTGAWLTVTQAMITRFGEVTHDVQWIHVDPARAARELPDGRTITHGYLLLSLLPYLSESVYRVDGVFRSLNYGADRIRFVSPVAAGARIRAQVTCLSAETDGDRTKAIFESVVEIEGEAKPALIAETIILFLWFEEDSPIGVRT